MIFISTKKISDAYLSNIIRCRVNADNAQLAVLSDVHQGLNDRDLLKRRVGELLELGPNCKVILGGDSTNSTTKNSKGCVLEEWATGDEQIQAIVEDIRPLYESGQLIGIIDGNHNKRVYNDAYISVGAMIASLLGDRSLFKGEVGIVYFNVNKNCYIHHILHKHKRTKNYYDYFNADVTWFEHMHEPVATPKLMVEHNKYTKKPIVKEVWELRQPSFQAYPAYAKESGFRPLPMGNWIVNMSGGREHEITPFLNSTYYDIVKGGKYNWISS